MAKRIVKLQPELRERLQNIIQSMLNVSKERIESEIDFDFFIKETWEFDEIADEILKLDLAQNGKEE